MPATTKRAVKTQHEPCSTAFSAMAASEYVGLGERLKSQTTGHLLGVGKFLSPECSSFTENLSPVGSPCGTEAGQLAASERAQHADVLATHPTANAAYPGLPGYRQQRYDEKLCEQTNDTWEETQRRRYWKGQTSGAPTSGYLACPRRSRAVGALPPSCEAHDSRRIHFLRCFH